MAIQRDTDRNLGVGSVKAAKQADKKLTATIKYKPPVVKPVPLKKVTMTPSRPHQNLEDVTTGALPMNKIGDLRPVKLTQQYAPIRYETDPITGETKALKKTVFAYNEETPTLTTAKKLYNNIKYAKPEEASKLYGNLNDYGKKTFWSYVVGHGKIDQSRLTVDMQNDMKRFAGAEYSKVEAMEKAKTAELADLKAKAQRLQAEPLKQQEPTTEQKLQELMNRKQATPVPSGSARQLTQGLPSNLNPSAPTTVLNAQMDKSIQALSPNAQAPNLSARSQTQGMQQSKITLPINLKNKQTRLDELQKLADNKNWGSVQYGLAKGLTMGLTSAKISDPREKALLDELNSRMYGGGNVQLSQPKLGVRPNEFIGQRNVKVPAVPQTAVGEMAGSLIPGAGAITATRGALASAGLAGKGLELLSGAIGGAGQTAVTGVLSGDDVSSIASNVLVGAGIGALSDLAIAKIMGKIKTKYAGKAITPEVEQAIKNETEQAVKSYRGRGGLGTDIKKPTIQTELGLKRGTTAEEALKMSEQATKDIQAEQYYKKFDKKKAKIVDTLVGIRRLPVEGQKATLVRSLKESGIKPEEMLSEITKSKQDAKAEMIAILNDGMRQGGTTVPVHPGDPSSADYIKSLNDPWFVAYKKKFNKIPSQKEIANFADEALKGNFNGMTNRPGVDEMVQKYKTAVEDENMLKGILSQESKPITLQRKPLQPKPFNYPKGERTNVNQPTLSEAYALRKNQPPTIAPKPLKPSVGSETLPNGEKPTVTNVGAKTAPIDERTGFKVPQAELKVEKPTVGKNIKDSWDKFYSRFVDFNNPLKKVGGKAHLTATVNKASTPGLVENMLKNELVDSQGHRIGKSLKEVYKGFPQDEDADLFEQYMRHKNNIDRAKTITKEVPYVKDGKPVMNADGTPKTRTEVVKEANNVYPDYTSEESAALVKKLDELHPDWNAKQKEVTNWIDTFMKEWSVNKGLISPEDYQNLRDMYENYVPTNREFSELEKNIGAGQTGSKGFADQPGVIKGATGSNRNINPTIENIMNMVNRTVSIAKKNEVGQEILKATRENPNNVIKILSDAEAEAIDKTRNNIVSVFENGKRTYMQVNDPEFMKAINGMNKIDGDVTKFVRMLNQAYKALITTKNVLFTVPNAVKDIQSSFINGTEQNPVKFAHDLWSAYVDIAKGSASLKQYKGLGGIGGNFSADKTKQFAKEMVNNPNLFIKALNAIEGFNNIVETAPRLAEFKRVLKATGNPQKALYAGYDITTNFSRGGDITKAADVWIPYLNAGVQGLDKAARQIGRHPFLTFAKGVGAITVPSIILNELNKDNPNYKDLDNRTRDNYFVFANPMGPKDAEGYPTTFIKLPKERTLGMAFGSLVDRVYSGDFKDYGLNTLQNMAPANPLTSNLLAPIYNLKANKTFSGADIVPRSLQGLSKHLQYDEKTSEIAKGIATAASKAGIELSPKQIDFIIRSYTGVIAQIGLPATTKSTYSGTSDVKNLAKPVVSRFTADVAYNNKPVGNFYDNLDEINKKVNDAKKLTPKLFAKGLKTPSQIIQSRMGKYSDLISELNKKAAAEVEPDKQREYRMKSLELAKKANDYYKQAKSKLKP